MSNTDIPACMHTDIPGALGKISHLVYEYLCTNIYVNKLKSVNSYVLFAYSESTYKLSDKYLALF